MGAEPSSPRGDGDDVNRNSVGAVVVAYFPDAELEKRLALTVPQVRALVVVDNTPDGGCGERLRPVGTNVEVIENRANLGVSAALNQGLERAASLGCRWLLTLDQDTSPYADMVATLLEAQRHCELAPVVVGGNYLDPRNGVTEAPTGEGFWVERTTVITSGCIVDVPFARSIGGFREDYFIDQLDHEFCLRVRRHGGKVVLSRKPVMAHSVGGPGGAYIPFWGAFPNHAPLRKYYMARNSLVTIADYWRQEPSWCARRLARLVLGLGLTALLEERRLAKVRAFAMGVVDGLRRQLGPCRRVLAR